MKIRNIIIILSVAGAYLAEAKTVRAGTNGNKHREMERKLALQPDDGVDYAEVADRAELPEAIGLKLAQLEEADIDDILMEGDVDDDDFDDGDFDERRLQPCNDDSCEDGTRTFDIYYRNRCQLTITAYVNYYANGSWRTRSMNMSYNPSRTRYMATADHDSPSHFYTCARASGARFTCWKRWNVPSWKETWTHSFSCSGTVTPSDPCSSDPCRNGASCQNVGSDDYKCKCRGDWLGKNCDARCELKCSKAERYNRKKEPYPCNSPLREDKRVIEQCCARANNKC